MAGAGGSPAGCDCHWFGTGEEPLDRALVSGLMLDAALGAFPWPPDPQALGLRLKGMVQEAMLIHLAGRITLDRFRGLIFTLENSFSFYFPLILSLLRRPSEITASPETAAPGVKDVFTNNRGVHGERLAEALSRLQGLLPTRPRSKLTGPKLLDFLGATGGAWFKLRDFQEYFAMDRKTAWEYVQKFWQAGLLIHNGGKAAAVRYGLAEGFLRVRAGAVRREAAAVLADIPSSLAVRVADLLIISGGEPFREQDWGRFLPSDCSRKIIHHLTSTTSLLEATGYPDESNRLLRLQPHWLQSFHPSS
ncbi:MAG: hypothetical protein C4567_18090 [Deltaproteobacteria bacterium]|nr:MAG: hypothetical protein C4567_18090 [Deltaproteobacteria bacterium]